MKIILSGTLESLSTRQDQTVKLVIGTQELDASDAGRLFQLRNKFLKCLLSDDNISTLEEELVSAHQTAAPSKKTPSQRLRAVLFLVWKQSGTEEAQDQFYEREIERIIEHYKAKLQP